MQRSILIDGHGIPSTFLTVRANCHDVSCALPTVDRLYVGNRRRRPKRLRADQGYDSVLFRRRLRQRGIRPAIDARGYRRRRQPPRDWDDRAEIRYAPGRWNVEQRIACLDQQRRLDVLFERTRGTYATFTSMACVRQYRKLLARCRQ